MVIESGAFSAVNLRLTASRTADTVADGGKGASNFLFAAGLPEFNDAAVLDNAERVRSEPDPGRSCYCPLLSAELADGRRLRLEEMMGADVYRLTWTSATDMAECVGDEMEVVLEKVAAATEVTQGLDASLLGPRRIAQAAAAACAAAKVNPTS